jgi:hypothetical protein
MLYINKYASHMILLICKGAAILRMQNRWGVEAILFEYNLTIFPHGDEYFKFIIILGL